MLPYRRLDPNPFPDLGNHVLEPLPNRERREPTIQPNAIGFEPPRVLTFPAT